MSYTKTNWSSGDVITAEKLNNIEGGVEAASGNIEAFDVIFSTTNWSTWTCDKTFEEISSAISSGKLIRGYWRDTANILMSININSSGSDSISFDAVQYLPSNGFYYYYLWTINTVGNITCGSQRYTMTLYNN